MPPEICGQGIHAYFGQTNEKRLATRSLTCCAELPRPQNPPTTQGPIMNLTLADYERINPHVEIDGIKFFTPNRHCAWRMETLFTKEPDTIEWLRGMKSGEVFYDVGANIGQYALIAAQRGLNVHAFEPES